MELFTFFGNIIVVAVAFVFLKRLGESVPILELMLLIAGLQWVVGPTIEYYFPSNHFKYYMYVPESAYMGIIVPAYGLFVLGVLLGLQKKGLGIIPVAQLQRYKQYGILIFSKADTLNAKFCASNKLFEYLVCGLEVWVSKEQEGTQPYVNTTSRPRVKLLDFEYLSEDLINDYHESKYLPVNNVSYNFDNAIEMFLTKINNAVS